MAKAKPRKKTSLKKIIWSAAGFILFVIFVAGFFFLQHVIEGLPPIEDLENPQQSLASNVYSIDGEEIGQFFIQNRIETKIDSIPPQVINALIATEDRKFYDHWGVDLVRFAKAMVKNVIFFSREGASTITQQLAKNLYEFKEGRESLFETGVRKVREWITAVQIEQTYTKSEILAMYFNESYFGHGAYGIGMAAKTYFGKKVTELTIHEASVLIALLKSSVYYDPYRRYNTALSRRNLIMRNMVVMDFITKEKYNELSQLPIELSYEKTESGFRSNLAPHFVEYVRQQMNEYAKIYNFDLYEDGLSIYTTLDTRMQRIANESIPEHIEEFQSTFDKRFSWTSSRDNRQLFAAILDEEIKKRVEYKNAANREEQISVYHRLKNNVAFIDSIQKVKQRIEVGFVALDVKHGDIRAMVGRRDPKQAYGLNHATQIRRQPGSSFKPIIYTVAIDNGIYPAYPILNQPFDFNGWSPKNFDESTSGFVTLRDALRRSLNIVSARLIIEGHVELWQIGKYARSMGIESKLNLVPAISLGTEGVTPLELANAYATLGNKGIHNDPISILKIEDKDGILIDSFAPQSREAISEETAYIVCDMLNTVMNEGTGAGARSRFGFHRPAGGKTGTAQSYSDAWFVGFTPQISAAVWVGFDDHRIKFTGDYGQGGRAALPIWAIFMKNVYEELDLPLEDFEMPKNGNILTVDFCSHTIFELGDPRIVSPDCNSGTYTDIIKLNDVPPMYNSERDTEIKIFDKYLAKDSTAHEAIEIQ
ncbi:MAG: penicillin-binding protein [Melioribacteraceae bacterium]|nr:penicillin-binding protein [Melioribacteraceae bacterium]MCF8354620.1 penicillin-binding protein [Melioribacteraceae bacterium]MCF8395008.1 penicillin-binding protein [Melioribacteraceae bacterium]MCF8418888.1 penicillin-binding protein [Melioribacteraceae bacterium]